MKFYQLLNKYPDKEIIARVVKLYPDQKKNIDGYITALYELREKKKKPSKMTIVLETVKEKGEEDWISILGKEKKETYAIGLTSWREWLGMEINKGSLMGFRELDILAHCLWEMTWHGYSDKEVQKTLAMMWDRVKEIDADIKKKKK